MAAANVLKLPELETLIPMRKEDVALSKDGRTYLSRITFDDASGQWVIASHFNEERNHWVSIVPSRRLGIIVFLNDKPESTDTHIKITSIKRNGRGLWADPVQVTKGDGE